MWIPIRHLFISDTGHQLMPAKKKEKQLMMASLLHFDSIPLSIGQSDHNSNDRPSIIVTAVEAA